MGRERERVEHDPAARRGGVSTQTGHQLNDAVSVLWRSAQTVQFELGSRRIVIDNVRSDQLAVLLPRRGGPGWSPVNGPAGDQPPGAAGLRDLLLGEGFLVRTSADPDGATFGRSAASRLSGDRIALTARFGESAGSVLSARRRAAIAVHGTSRLAPVIAATLAAGGVGRVQLVHGGEVAAADSCPGGLTPADEGRRFAAAAADAVRRAAPDADTAPIPRDRSADLIILTDPAPVDPAVCASMHLDGLAHLACAVRGGHAVIGPLVIPGITSCLRCADLHRADRDPAWPALAVQLGRTPAHRVPSDVALCVATAGIAATQALEYLDRERPTTIDATLEWQLPDWRLRRRSWPVHHSCECGAAARVTRARHNGTVIPR